MSDNKRRTVTSPCVTFNENKTMGCNQTRVAPISNTPELIAPLTIDQLPVEIIYKILDELDVCTAFSTLYNVCNRFNEILSTYNQYHLNFENYFNI